MTMGRPRGSTSTERRAVPGDAKALRDFGWITTGEVADALGVHRSTILARIHRGEIPAVELPTDKLVGKHKHFVKLRDYLARGNLIEGSPGWITLQALSAELPAKLKPIPQNLRAILVKHG